MRVKCTFLWQISHNALRNTFALRCCLVPCSPPLSLAFRRHLVNFSLPSSHRLLSATISSCAPAAIWSLTLCCHLVACALHLCHPPSCNLLCSKSLLLTQVAHASRPSHALSVGHWGCPCKVHPTNPCNLLMPPGLTF